MNIKRVVSKLKIELHQDYLCLGQINLHFQTSSVSQSGAPANNNASMTTFELPFPM